MPTHSTALPRRSWRIEPSRPAAQVVVAVVACVAAHAALAPRAVAAPSAAAGYVVYVRGGESATYRARSSALATRVESLGARLTRALLDGLPAQAPSPLRPETRTLVRSPLAFDPTRVWLVEAPDSTTVATAALRLVRDGDAEWAEPLVMREPADAHPWPRAGVMPASAALEPTAVPTASTPAADAPRASDLPPDFPDDPLFRDGRQWGLLNTGSHAGIAGSDIRAAAAWRRSCGAPWLRLAIVDTGIDPAHPDLRLDLADGPRIERGLNLADDPSRSWADSAAHGTAVAGVMAALTGDGAHFDSLGMAGVCGGDGVSNPGCRIVPLKITAGHATAASSFDIARGILAGLASGARVVNVSFGGAGASRLEREALRYSIERGCLVVAASGNRGASAPRDPVYPAAYAADGLCLQVGAADAWDRRALFSSYGPGLDLVAPGVDVWTTFLSYPSASGASYPGYVAVSGTSFAAPFTTGAAGLLAAARPELEPDDIRQLLRAGARDIGAPGPDQETGVGMLDADAALRAVTPDIGIWHDEVAADTWTDAGVDSLVVTENGLGNMTGPRTWAAARRIEARVELALPDSFVGEARVWSRVAGTSTVRGDFRLPYFAPRAEVAWTGLRTFMLRGWLYRVEAGGDSLDLPLPFDQARFGFTVLGRVQRPRVGRPVDRPVLELRVGPNPFTTSLHIEHPADAAVDLYDIGGRRVRAWAPDGSVRTITWDGRDSAGRRSPPGLYWVRARGASGSRQLRVIKLE